VDVKGDDDITYPINTLHIHLQERRFRLQTYVLVESSAERVSRQRNGY
jgi:hypothetical protein